MYVVIHLRYSSILEVIISIFILIVIVQLLFWIGFTFMLHKRKLNPSHLPSDLPAVSIVVCFKNEVANLQNLLDFLTQQEYPQYEIILVNDHSNDPFNPIIAAFNDSRIKVFHLPDSAQGKKMAQDYGIRNASHDIILVTDADCTGSNLWIKSMINGLRDKSICLGFAPLTSAGTLSSQFSVFESWMAGVQYLSYASAGVPYMGVGRNMAFKKSLFTETGGHKNHLDLASGDDDLFVNAVANASNTTVQLDPNSFIWSPAKRSWSSYLNQKVRHLSTSVRYQFKHQLLLSIFALSQIGFYLIPIISVFYLKEDISILLITFAIALIIKYTMALFIHKILPCRNLPLSFPLMDIMLAIYYAIMPLYIAIKRNTTWK